ncbi:MAG: type III-A CRISPR-associated protein Csm2 [Megasphaera sp.]|uniref:type III-A CRISPR-associated protein Csm2 n=1 Tax=Megasphaera sp. TaxID=2023260 RepID=UPI003F0E5C1C
MRDIAKEAEDVILNLKDQNHGRIYLKTNQIRKFLTAVNAITNKVNVYKAKHLDATELPDELAGEIQFLKVKAAYQAGRERSVKDFMVQSKMKHHIEGIGTSISKYEEFAHYIEALVAYHKFHGGD